MYIGRRNTFCNIFASYLISRYPLQKEEYITGNKKFVDFKVTEDTLILDCYQVEKTLGIKLLGLQQQEF